MEDASGESESPTVLRLVILQKRQEIVKMPDATLHAVTGAYGYSGKYFPFLVLSHGVYLPRMATNVRN
jgi:hypothetical protein